LPLWQLTFNDSPYILFSDGTYRSLGSMAMWLERFDHLRHYRERGEDIYFQLCRNDDLFGDRRSPLMHPSLWERSQQIVFKYGIYEKVTFAAA
jgi:hypothetical protein